MGIADLIPGISGGTIALITNIYDELIFSINSISIRSLKMYINEQTIENDKKIKKRHIIINKKI